jgi:hypothetical protein
LWSFNFRTAYDDEGAFRFVEFMCEWSSLDDGVFRIQRCQTGKGARPTADVTNEVMNADGALGRLSREEREAFDGWLRQKMATRGRRYDWESTDLAPIRGVLARRMAAAWVADISELAEINESHFGGYLVFDDKHQLATRSYPRYVEMLLLTGPRVPQSQVRFVAVGLCIERDAVFITRCESGTLTLGAVETRTVDHDVDLATLPAEMIEGRVRSVTTAPLAPPSSW